MIFLVTCKWINGDIYSIKGYSVSENEANKKVEELNAVNPRSERFYYEVDIVESI